MGLSVFVVEEGFEAGFCDALEATCLDFFIFVTLTWGSIFSRSSLISNSSVSFSIRFLLEAGILSVVVVRFVRDAIAIDSIDEGSGS